MDQTPPRSLPHLSARAGSEATSRGHEARRRTDRRGCGRKRGSRIHLRRNYQPPGTDNGKREAERPDQAVSRRRCRPPATTRSIDSLISLRALRRSSAVMVLAAESANSSMLSSRVSIEDLFFFSVADTRSLFSLRLGISVYFISLSAAAKRNQSLSVCLCVASCLICILNSDGQWPAVGGST